MKKPCRKGTDIESNGDSLKEKVKKGCHIDVSELDVSENGQEKDKRTFFPVFVVYKH